MTNKLNTNQKVEEALHSLDGLQRAEASPFLLSGILHLLPDDNRWWSVVAATLSKPAIAIALSTVILLLHFWLLFSNTAPANESQNDQVSDLAIAYHFDQNNLPDQNPTLP